MFEANGVVCGNFEAFDVLLLDYAFLQFPCCYPTTKEIHLNYSHQRKHLRWFVSKLNFQCLCLVSNKLQQLRCLFDDHCCYLNRYN